MDSNLTGTIAALMGAVAALMGVVIGQYTQYRSEKRKQQEREKDQITRLDDLIGLLRASRINFKTQTDDVETFYNYLRKKYPNRVAELEGSPQKYQSEQFLQELVFSTMFKKYSENELKHHNDIRNKTVAQSAINDFLLAWVKNDTYYKANINRNELYDIFSKRLLALHVHLLLWKAKYDTSIPINPENSLNYVGSFPTDITEIAQSVKYNTIATKHWWQFWKIQSSQDRILWVLSCHHGKMELDKLKTEVNMQDAALDLIIDNLVRGKEIEKISRNGKGKNDFIISFI